MESLKSQNKMAKKNKEISYKKNPFRKLSQILGIFTDVLDMLCGFEKVVFFCIAEIQKEMDNIL